MARTEGLERLKLKIARLPVEAHARMKEALDQSADELVAMQKRLAPRDEGDLINSIEKAPGRHELAVIVRAGGKAAPHAKWVEYGTSKMAARPFFWPSWRALRKRIKGKMSRAATKAAKVVAAGGQ
jgi:HK97 gp10 family phage protein